LGGEGRAEERSGARCERIERRSIDRSIGARGGAGVKPPGDGRGGSGARRPTRRRIEDCGGAWNVRGLERIRHAKGLETWRMAGYSNLQVLHPLEVWPAADGDGPRVGSARLDSARVQPTTELPWSNSRSTDANARPHLYPMTQQVVVKKRLRSAPRSSARHERTRSADQACRLHVCESTAEGTESA
jgi:hypothetical protein